MHTIGQIFPLHVLFISTLFVESWSRFADENVDDEFWDIKIVLINFVSYETKRIHEVSNNRTSL